jgi:hypothetical protein
MGLMLRDTANSLTICKQADYDLAATFLVEIKTKMKEVEAAMEPQCKSAYESWQTALTQKKKYLAPYVEAEGIVKRSIGVYQLEQHRIAAEAEAKAREEAARAEEKERAKLLKKAGKALAKGDDNKAAELESQAEMVFVPAVTPDHSVTKAEGISTTDSIDVEVKSIMEFLKWLVTGDAVGTVHPDMVVSIKLQPLKQYIKLAKITQIPGVMITKKVIVSVKGKL